MTRANSSANSVPEKVLANYMLVHNASRLHAEAIFGELEKFFVVASTSGARCSPSRAVDEAWHAFLEHEDEYREYFCVAGRKPLTHVVRSTPTLAAYEHTRTLIHARFASVDERFWPSKGDSSTCSPCEGE